MEFLELGIKFKLGSEGKLGRTLGLRLVTRDAVQASTGFRSWIMADAGKGYLA